VKISYEAQFVPYEACNQAGKGSALVFAPHPDDEAVGCSGGIIGHVLNNEQVHVVIVTDGRLGDPELANKIGQGTVSENEVSAYILTRQEESQRAGEILGYGKPIFWGVRDRELLYDEELIIKVLEAVNRFKPCAVYSPSIFEMHPDHRNLAMIVLEAIRRLKIKPDLFMYEVGRLIPSPDILFDITDHWDQKLRAVKCFESQLSVCPFHEYISSLNHFRTFTLPADVKMAEAYMVIRNHDFNHRIKDILMAESQDREKRQDNTYKDSFPGHFTGWLSSQWITAPVRALKQIFQRER
jgi:LmbE family N-acetylglucosaminyl deacetylase